MWERLLLLQELIHCHVCIKVKVKVVYIRTLSHSYGVSLAIRDHTALPVTRHK